MGFQQQQQQQQQQEQQQRKQKRFDEHNWIEKEQFQWRALQQQQQELLRYQYLQQKEQQQQQEQQLSRTNFHITSGNDGIGSSQLQFYSSPNISHHSNYLDQQQSQAKCYQYQEEQMPKNLAQFHNFQFQNLLPPHPPHPACPGVSVGLTAVAAGGANVAFSTWGVSPQGASSQNCQFFEPELAPWSDGNDTNDATTESRKRSSTAVLGNNHVDKPGGKKGKNGKPSAKRSIHSERKREQERQRRLDLNENFNALVEVVSGIETEEAKIDQKKQKGEIDGKSWPKLKERCERQETGGTKNKDPGEDDDKGLVSGTHSPESGNKNTMPSMAARSTAAILSAARLEFKSRFSAFISPSNRADLVARTISHLERYVKIQNHQVRVAKALRKKIEEVKREQEEGERKLKKIKEYYSVAAERITALTNPTSVAVGSNGMDTDNTNIPTATDDDGDNCPQSSFKAISTHRQRHQKQQQPQPQMMMMMMPMIVDTDNARNPVCSQQFMHMPMPTMGTQQFSNMMMTLPPQAAVEVPCVTAQQQGLQPDQDDQQQQQEEPESKDEMAYSKGHETT